jgi:hypothetical protein
MRPETVAKSRARITPGPPAGATRMCGRLAHEIGMQVQPAWGSRLAIASDQSLAARRAGRIRLARAMRDDSVPDSKRREPEVDRAELINRIVGNAWNHCDQQRGPA